MEQSTSKRCADTQRAATHYGHFQFVSVLVSGDSQLSCSLQAYHWLLTVDLAWFSSIIHLTTLTCLRHYFQERPALKLWRICCVGITAIVLGISLESKGYAGKNLDPVMPAWCLFHASILAKDSSGTPSFNGVYVAAILDTHAFSNSTIWLQLCLFPTETISAGAMS